MSFLGKSFAFFAATTTLAFTPGLARASRQLSAGYAGKPNTSMPQGQSCADSCHSGGTLPTVNLTAMTAGQITAGQTKIYTLSVTGGANLKGAAVAVSDGVEITAGAGMQASFDELVHSNTQTGAAEFKFSVKGPPTNGTFSIWYAGLAANNNGGTSGDRGRAGKLDVTVTGGTAPGSDAGTGTGDAGIRTDAGATTDGGSTTPPAKDAGRPRADAGAGNEEEEEGDGTTPPATSDSGGCSVSETGGDVGAGASALVVMGLGLLFARRRR